MHLHSHQHSKHSLSKLQINLMVYIFTLKMSALNAKSKTKLTKYKNELNKLKT